MEPVSWTFTTTAATSGCPCTIWPATATPAGTDSDTAGRAGRDVPRRQRRVSPASATTGPASPPARTSAACGAGPAPGSVRSIFTDGTASGWQEATFASPIPVDRRDDLVASYYTPSRYVARRPPTSPSRPPRAGRSRPCRTAPTARNGLYRYTSARTGTFPDQSLQQPRTTGWTSSSRTVGHDQADRHGAHPRARCHRCQRGGQRHRDVLRAGAATAPLGLELRDPAAPWSPAPRRTTPATRTATLDPSSQPGGHDDLHRDRHAGCATPPAT